MPCATTGYGLDTLEDELYESSREGNMEGVTEAIKEGADVKTGTNNYTTILNEDVHLVDRTLTPSFHHRCSVGPMC